MVLEAQCLQGVGAFEVHLLKVFALKLSHPSACSVFRTSATFPYYDTVSAGSGEGGSLDILIWNLGFEIELCQIQESYTF
jgi:hypothetical protein